MAGGKLGTQTASRTLWWILAHFPPYFSTTTRTRDLASTAPNCGIDNGGYKQACCLSLWDTPEQRMVQTPSRIQDPILQNGESDYI